MAQDFTFLSLPLLLSPPVWQMRPYGNHVAPQVQFYLNPAKVPRGELPPLQSNFLTCLGCLPVWRLARHVYNMTPLVRETILAAQRPEQEGGAEAVNGSGAVLNGKATNGGRKKGPGQLHTVSVRLNGESEDVGIEVTQFLEILCLEKVSFCGG